MQCVLLKTTVFSREHLGQLMEIQKALVPRGRGFVQPIMESFNQVRLLGRCGWPCSRVGVFTTFSLTPPTSKILSLLATSNPENSEIFENLFFVCNSSFLLTHSQAIRSKPIFAYLSRSVGLLRRIAKHSNPTRVCFHSTYQSPL